MVAILQDGKLTNARRLLAGFCAGITEALVIVTPFEVVKIKLQQQRGMRREDMRYTVQPCPLSSRSPYNPASRLTCARSSQVMLHTASLLSVQDLNSECLWCL